MLEKLPTTALEFMTWSWERLQPFFDALGARPLSAATLPAWLADWSQLQRLVNESFQRLYVATTVDTSDQHAEQRYKDFLDHIHQPFQSAEQALKEKLLASRLAPPPGMEIPLRNLRAEADLFRPENLPLLGEERKLSIEYDHIVGAQTVSWEGQETPLPQLIPVYFDPDRPRRERAWRLAMERTLQDRPAINDLWQRLLDTRCQIAANAGLSDYRLYKWRQMLRFDYTPEDCFRFHDAIEQVVVPAVERLYERRRKRLGLETVRPWDIYVDSSASQPLKPFASLAELDEKTAAIFHKVDPQLGEYYQRMRQAQVLDLDNRKNKAPGGYCTEFPVARLPFIFMNAVGVHEDVQTLLHEGGHAFHFFEASALPYHPQLQVGMEFAEVASMSMELLGAPYLADGPEAFYNRRDAARALINNIEDSLRFWPYMAVVDAFQHWVYTHANEARSPQACDACWAALWRRYMVGVDWSGLEAELETGWHRKAHIHQDPFYYVEYGLAQLGAMQVWRNARRDQAGAVAAYRRALALGGTASLPELYAAAGARLAFDAATLGEAVDLIESAIVELEAQL
jgi:oligoendopeptidase F